MKRVFSLLLCALMLCLCLTGCGSDNGEPSKLSFSESASMDTLKKLDGKKVTITGYMATLSPLDGSYIYLMNMPYQSCPFCVPNTQQLANTLAVYAAKGSSFDFTDRPVKITGKLSVGDYSDDYGYTYNYRIVDAAYEIVDLSQISEQYAVYQSLCEDNVVADIYASFDWLYFICNWTEYTSYYTDENGEDVTFFLYAGDVQNYIADEGPYGYATQASDDYYPALARRVKAVAGDSLPDLISVLNDCDELAKYARGQLDGEKYSYDPETDKFTLNEADELNNRYRDLYLRFDQWLTQYEL